MDGSETAKVFSLEIFPLYSSQFCSPNLYIYISLSYVLEYVINVLNTLRACHYAFVDVLQL